MLDALNLPPSIAEHLPWYVAGLIVVLGLLVYGFRDVRRFSLKRTWAISSVNFAESIRRRVLWITPLAILGVIVVSQLQKPIDEQDAIRQTTKFALFASGMLVTITAIILACTNLPREIDSRVIYTVVTKPTTRLEIVVGKVLGFARVSGAILLIMGLFTFVYLQIRAWNFQQYIVQRLDSNTVDAQSRPTLEHYRSAGLLAARSYDRPDDLQIHSRIPAPDDERRFVFGGGEGQFRVPFVLDEQDLVRQNDPNQPVNLAIAVFVGFEESTFEGEQDDGQLRPTTIPFLLQNPDATDEQVMLAARRNPPSVNIEILDFNFNTLIEPSLINGGKAVVLEDRSGRTRALARIQPDAMARLAAARVFYISVIASTGGYEYFTPGNVPIVIATDDQRQINPWYDPNPATGRQFALPTYVTRTGTFGMQLRGGPVKAPLAIYKFRDAPINADADGNVPFELKVGIERSTSEDDDDSATRVDISVIDRHTGNQSPPVSVYPETNRTSFFKIPKSAISSGDFDVVVTAKTRGQYIGINRSSLQLVTADESFAFNLIKSLFVLWLMAILVVIVSIFCSTFLSWPIAIVLTLLILLGRWGVMQLGDATQPGIGNLVVTDLFPTKDARIATTVSNTVEALTRGLNLLTSVLPDITRFSALEDLEAGVALPMARITEALGVMAVFGLPMIVLAYVLLRHKEVAP